MRNKEEFVSGFVVGKIVVYSILIFALILLGLISFNFLKWIMVIL